MALVPIIPLLKSIVEKETDPEMLRNALRLATERLEKELTLPPIKSPAAQTIGGTKFNRVPERKNQITEALGREGATVLKVAKAFGVSYQYVHALNRARLSKSNAQTSAKDATESSIA